MFPLVVAMLVLVQRSAGFVATHKPLSSQATRLLASVSGSIYEASSTSNAPTIRLFTKEGCTLCDKVKGVLESLEEELPHSLVAVDITDSENDEWFKKYKYDIPVLHVGDEYWIKHRITVEEAKEGLEEASNGSFSKRSGEPDAGELERRQAERLENK